MSYQGLYINLDRSTGRRAEIEQELARVNLGGRYRRMAAIEGSALTEPYVLPNRGAVGCFLSHAEAMRQACAMDQYVHVIEDDVIFSTRTAPILDQLIASGAADPFDILFSDIGLPLSAEKLQPFKSLYARTVTRAANGAIDKVAFQLLDLKEVDFTGAGSYLVNRKSAAKILVLYDEEIRQGLRAPVDDFIRLQGKVGTLRVGCIFPFITSLRIEHARDSTIRAQADPDRRFTATDIARASFFIDCDWDECQRLADLHTPPLRDGDRHAKLLAQLLTYNLADNAAPTAKQADDKMFA